MLEPMKLKTIEITPGAMLELERLAELLRTVEHGETVAIRRHGRTIAHVVPAPSDERGVRGGAGIGATGRGSRAGPTARAPGVAKLSSRGNQACTTHRRNGCAAAGNAARLAHSHRYGAGPGRGVDTGRATPLVGLRCHLSRIGEAVCRARCDA